MKKNNKTTFTFIITFLFISCGITESKKENVPSQLLELNSVLKSLNINTSTSTVEWKGVMIGIYSHNGFVSVKEGNLVWQGNSISSGYVTIDMQTMSQTDSLYKTEENKLVAHLKSPDFFDVANFPTATFEIISSDQNTNKIYGDLTVRGITNHEVVENVVLDGRTKSATGTLKFDRQKYGVAYKGSKKDMLVGDEVEMTISLNTEFRKIN
jgi:polyisoprenoid-binding protein YceI